MNTQHCGAGFQPANLLTTKSWCRFPACLFIPLLVTGCIDFHNVGQNISNGQTELTYVLLSYATVNEKGDQEHVAGDFAAKVTIYEDSIVIKRVDGTGRVIPVDDTFRGIRWEPAPQELIDQAKESEAENASGN
jgi:hypothetical protein